MFLYLEFILYINLESHSVHSGKRNVFCISLFILLSCATDSPELLLQCLFDVIDVIVAFYSTNIQSLYIFRYLSVSK